MDMRGLSTFIADIRKCQTKETEQKRIEEELAKIRKKFQSSGTLKGYDRKKYICKLLYIYMLGYEIDFGHMEAINLLSSDKYSEKHMGYLACTLLLHEEHELLTLITNSIKNDLVSNNEFNQCLALAAVGNVGSKEFAESLGQDVQKLLISGETKTIVRKKAALSLLRLYKKYPEILPAESWSERVVNLLGGRDLGVITSLMGLILGLVEKNPSEYEPAIPKVVRLLTKLVVNREYSNDYIYYGIPSPWLQIKLLRLLSYYPPPSDQTLLSHITQILNRIINGIDKSKIQEKKSVSKNNAIHAVFFEALNLAIRYDIDSELLRIGAEVLGKYISDNKDTNLKYLALDAMSKLVGTNEGPQDQIRKHQETILFALKDPDISIRRKALDLIYTMCDRVNAGEIVGELLAYLPIADFAIREELVLKIAILAEKFATELSWYVDVILNLISQAGDFVSEAIWYRVVQIVASNQGLQQYAADSVFKAVSSPAAHENCVKVAGYILGEYGYLIADKPDQGPLAQFNALHSKFYINSIPTKALLLNTYIKFYNMFEDQEVRGKIVSVFKTFRDNIDSEIQQRANEYFHMAGSLADDLMKNVLANMPAYKKPEGTEASNEEASPVPQISTNSQPQQQTQSSSLIPDLFDTTPATSSPAMTASRPTNPPPTQPNPNDLDQFLSGLSSGPSTAPPQNNALFTTPASTMAASLPALDPFTPVAPMSNNNSNPASLAAQAASFASKMQHDRGDVGVEQKMEQNKEMEREEEIAAVQADAVSRFHQLCIENQGILLEDTRLQIAIKAEFKSHLGRLMLVFGNKAGYPLNQVRATAVSIPQLKLQHSVVAPMIAPRTRVQQLISIEILEPFTEEINLSLFFEYEKQAYKYTLRLPVLVHKFAEPLAVGGGQQFFAKWNAIPRGPTEVQHVFKANSPINLDAIRGVLASGFNLGVLDGVDPKPTNFVCACAINTASGKIEVFLRLESNMQANAFRLTIKSNNPIAAAALGQVIMKHLEK